MNYDRRLDCYKVDFGYGAEHEQALIAEVGKMEANSEWIDGVETNSLELSNVDALSALEEAGKYGIGYDTALETGTDGTQLILHRLWNGARVKSWCVRDSARGTLYESAKLSGSALGRMSPEKLAETLNNGLHTARGKSLVLTRYGKVSAVHSDAAGGYRIMPISELVQTTREELQWRFGELVFQGGHNEHRYTSAVWTLPDSQADLVLAYEDALAEAGSHYAVNFMPAVRFFASDTAISSARLIPLFVMKNGREIRLHDGIKVEHERNTHGRKDGVDLYREQLGGLYAMFADAAAKAEELSHIEILNPVNAVVSLCRKFGIKKKWGCFAKEEIERLAVNVASLTAHDVYLSMTGIAADAKARRASSSTVNFLTEAVARVLTVTDWDEHDVSGIVGWSDYPG